MDVYILMREQDADDLAQVEQSFAEGEFEMARTLEEYTVRELKDYLLGLYAIPMRDFTWADRENMTEAKDQLRKRGYSVNYINDQRITFPKLKTGNWLLQNKETKTTVAVCIVEEGPATYSTTKGTVYLKDDWKAIMRCSASLVL